MRPEGRQLQVDVLIDTSSEPAVTCNKDSRANKTVSPPTLLRDLINPRADEADLFRGQRLRRSIATAAGGAGDCQPPGQPPHSRSCSLPLKFRLAFRGILKRMTTDSHV